MNFLIRKQTHFFFGFGSDSRDFLWQTYDQNYEEHVNVNI